MKYSFQIQKAGVSWEDRPVLTVDEKDLHGGPAAFASNLALLFKSKVRMTAKGSMSGIYFGYMPIVHIVIHRMVYKHNQKHIITYSTVHAFTRDEVIDIYAETMPQMRKKLRLIGYQKFDVTTHITYKYTKDEVTTTA